MNKMKPKTVVAPEEVSLECGLDLGEPEATVRWYHDNREIYDGDDKYDMRVRGNQATLVLRRTELSDSAAYRCEAANKLGRVSTEAQLTVQGEIPIDYIVFVYDYFVYLFKLWSGFR